MELLPRKNPSLANSKSLLVVKRENKINEFYKKSEKDAAYVEKSVRTNIFYNSFPAQSPGFDDIGFRLKMNKLLNN